jgi:hypothetical protein
VFLLINLAEDAPLITNVIILAYPVLDVMGRDGGLTSVPPYPPHPDDSTARVRPERKEKNEV